MTKSPWFQATSSGFQKVGLPYTSLSEIPGVNTRTQDQPPFLPVPAGFHVPSTNPPIWGFLKVSKGRITTSVALMYHHASLTPLSLNISTSFRRAFRLERTEHKLTEVGSKGEQRLSSSTQRSHWGSASELCCPSARQQHTQQHSSSKDNNQTTVAKRLNNRPKQQANTLSQWVSQSGS